MKPRFFWLYADRKTVKEISWEEWSKIVRGDYGRTKTHLMARVDKTHLYLRKGNSSVWIPRSQLMEILGHATSL